MRDEIIHVLTDYFSWERTVARTFLDRLLDRAVRVVLTGAVKACRDPKDDMFLECANRAGAGLIVAGDKDLLVLGSYKDTRIITPSDYVRD